MRAARGSSIALSFMLASSGCAEPSFVSLGRNLSRVTQGPDAGVMLDEGDPSEPDIETDPCVPGNASTSIVTDCELRAAVECPAINESEPEPVSALLTRMIIGCVGYRNRLTVRFSLGCATSFDLVDTSDTMLAACVAARLSAERYPCAEPVACGQGIYFPIPTASVEPDWY